MEGIVTGKVIKSISDTVPIDSDASTFIIPDNGSSIDLSSKRICVVCPASESHAYLTLIFPQADYVAQITVYGLSGEPNIIDCSKNENTTFTLRSSNANYSNVFSYNNTTKLLTEIDEIGFAVRYYFIMW